MLTVRSSDENTAENVQEKNQFSRFRILQTEVGEHFYVTYSLVMLTFRIEVKCLYSEYFGHALDRCWRDFMSFVNDLKFRDMALSQMTILFTD